MNTRVTAGALAIVGAVIVGIGCSIPYAETSDGVKYRIFETNPPHDLLYFAIEPAGVILAAVALGIVLLMRPLRFADGALAGIGGQTVLLFIGFIGFYAQTSFGGPQFDPHVKAGAWLGLLGGGLIGAAGVLLLVGASYASSEPGSSPPAMQPGGWLTDPWDTSQLRYWNGREWTPHTHPATAHAAAPAASPVAPT